MSKALREQRAALWDANKKLNELAEKECRNFTAEEQQEWDKRDKEIDALKGRIERSERSEVLTAEMAAKADLPCAPANLRQNPERGIISPAEAVDMEIRVNNALRAWCMPNRATSECRQAAHDLKLDLSANELTFNFSTKAPRSLRLLQKQIEQRAQSVGTTTAGGFSVADEMMAQVEVSLLAFGGMREMSTVIRTATGADMPIPTVDDTGQVGAILAENTGVSNQDVTFGQVVLQAFKYSSKQVLVSVELMQDSAVNIAGLLGRLLGERIARILNTHFTTGTGTGQPRGCVTAAGTGVTGGAGVAGAFTADNLIDLMHSVDPAYRASPKCAWMMRDATIAAVRKLKDTTNQYLWQPGLQGGDPDRLLGFPVVVNQDVAAVALSAKSVIFGDFSKYWIRDTLPFTLLRLDERYADAHQVGFLAFGRFDGDTIDAGTDPMKVFVGNAA